MSTKLEIAERKLQKLQNDVISEFKQGKELSKSIPFGQPNIIGRRNIYKDSQQHFKKAIKLSDEINKQMDKVEKLEKVEEFKNDNPLLKDIHIVGKNKYASIGAKTSVNNLSYFKQQLKELEIKNKKNKQYNKNRKANEPKKATYGTNITKLKRKIEMLEQMVEQDKQNQNTMSDKTKQLIESGQVTQWKKKPTYYFVKGAYKTALEINQDGDFIISPRYYPQNDKDLKYTKQLIEN